MSTDALKQDYELQLYSMTLDEVSSRLGFYFDNRKKSFYIDGHKQDNIVAIHKQFCSTYLTELEQLIKWWVQICIGTHVL